MGWLVGLSPWAQVPLIVLLALPACAAVSYVLLWVVDRLGLGLSTMANPEELRKQDQKLPKPQRKYPQSRVTQAMWVLIALVIVAAVISAL